MLNFIKSVVVVMVLFISSFAQAEFYPTDNVVQVVATPGTLRAPDKEYHYKDLIITSIADQLNVTDVVFNEPNCKGKFVTWTTLGRGEVAIYRVTNNCDYTGFKLITSKGEYAFANQLPN